jgi:hypothetical protein
MTKITRHIASFPAVDDFGGQHTLNVFQEFHEVLAGGSRTEVPGKLSFKMENGETVHRLTKGQYETAISNLRLHSDDPDAP